MCVQYIGGCSVQQRVFSTSGGIMSTSEGIMNTSEGVKYIGGISWCLWGYHEYIGGIPYIHRGIPWVHRGISWVHQGMFSTLGRYHDVCGGYHEYIGGYHEYIEGCSVHWGTFSTLGFSIEIERFLPTCSPTCIMISPMYSWYPPTYSWYPPMYSWYSSNVLMVSLQCTQGIPPMYSWSPPMYWTSPDVLNTHYTGCKHGMWNNGHYQVAQSWLNRLYNLLQSTQLLLLSIIECPRSKSREAPVDVPLRKPTPAKPKAPPDSNFVLWDTIPKPRTDESNIRLSRWHWISSLISYNFEILCNYRALEKLLDLIWVPLQDRRGRSKVKYHTRPSARQKTREREKPAKRMCPERSFPRTDASDKPRPRPPHQTDHHTQHRNTTISPSAPREGEAASRRNFCQKKKKLTPQSGILTE